MTRHGVSTHSNPEFSQKLETTTATRIFQYKDTVDAMTDEEIEKEMGDVLVRWDLDGGERYEMSLQDTMLRIFRNFDIDGTAAHDFGFNDVSNFVKKHIAQASTIYHSMFKRGMFDASPSYKLSMQNLLRVLLYAQNALVNLTWCRVSMKPHADDSHVDDHIIARFSPMDADDVTPFQNLLLYLLNQAYYKNYRKHRGFCYEAIYRNGFNTHAWKNVCSIKEFIFDVTNKEMHFDQWRNLTHGKDNARAAAEYLQNCKDGQFPDLVMDRHVFAFANGLYHCRHVVDDGSVTDAFYPFDGAARTPPDLTACNFFDHQFDNFDGVTDWYRDIPTPHLQSILDFQRFSPEVCRWMYVFLGRLMFDVGDLDGWQVIPFLKGIAGCHARGTPIMMYDGRTKFVEDVEVGDVLMGDDSTPRTVLSLARGRDPMYRIVPTKRNASSYVVNGRHILCLVFSGHGSVSKYKYGFIVQFWNHDLRCISARKFKTVELVNQFKESIRDLGIVEMTVEEYLRLPNYIKKYLKAYRVGVDFPTVEEPPLFDPWLLGYWLGDGDSAGTGITTADEDIVQKIREILPPSLHFNAVGTAKYKYRITTGRRGIGGANAFMNALRAYGLINNKHIPHVFKTGSRDTRMQVLAGLLDSDGYLEVGDMCYEITQKSKTLSRDIEFVARSLGFGCYIIECQKSCTLRSGEKKTGTYYRMHISGAGLEDLPMVLERKKAKTRVLSRDVLHYGFDVEPLEEDDYYGFTVDANHRYLLGDFTATHNSGKSTVVLKVARAFYEVNDVGTLSNNIERKFGLSAFADKLLFCAPEVKSDLHIEQAEFQSMVSGESIQINTKNKTAQSVEWKVPGILAGNEVPSWCDNSGSIARRVVLFDFARKVEHGDMSLGKKLELELPRLIKKCARAYLEAAGLYGKENVWNKLPPYFKTLQNEMAAATNSLENFIQSEKVVLGADLYCEWQVFVRAVQAHAKEYNFNLKTLSKDFYVGPFEKHGLRVDQSRKQRRYPRTEHGELKKCFWVLGCDLAQNMEMMDGSQTEQQDDSGPAKTEWML